jgi:hypothetical protein
MTYNKPEVEVLGNANAMIEFSGKNNTATDSSQPQPNSTGPAYDLDE